MKIVSLFLVVANLALGCDFPKISDVAPMRYTKPQTVCVVLEGQEVQLFISTLSATQCTEKGGYYDTVSAEELNRGERGRLMDAVIDGLKENQGKK